MSTDDSGSAPKKTLEEIQLDLAKVAFEVAKISAVLKSYMGPKNPLSATQSPQYVYEQLQGSYEKMMDLCGDLIGVSE